MKALLASRTTASVTVFVLQFMTFYVMPMANCPPFVFTHGLTLQPNSTLTPTLITIIVHFSSSTLTKCSLGQLTRRDFKVSSLPNVPRLRKIERQTVPQLSTAQQLSNEWSHFRVLYMVSKVRKLCITQGFPLGVKRLTNSTTVKYCSIAFQ